MIFLRTTKTPMAGRDKNFWVRDAVTNSSDRKKRKRREKANLTEETLKIGLF
jgi:hypothetical protein